MDGSCGILRLWDPGPSVRPKHTFKTEDWNQPSHHALIYFVHFDSSVFSISFLRGRVWQIFVFNFSLFEAYAKTQDAVARFFLLVCVWCGFVEFICFKTSRRCGCTSTDAYVKPVKNMSDSYFTSKSKEKTSCMMKTKHNLTPKFKYLFLMAVFVLLFTNYSD